MADLTGDHSLVPSSDGEGTHTIYVANLRVASPNPASPTPKPSQRASRDRARGMSHEIAKLMLEHAKTFLDREEAVKTALSLGMPLHEIEQYLDWLDQTPATPQRTAHSNIKAKADNDSKTKSFGDQSSGSR